MELIQSTNYIQIFPVVLVLLCVCIYVCLAIYYVLICVACIFAPTVKNRIVPS